MEYVHTVLAEIQATKADQADDLVRELEAHQSVASTMRGFRGMRISRSAHPEGNVQLVVETRWGGNNDMVDYSSSKENSATIVESHSDVIVPGSVEVHRMESVSSGGAGGDASSRMYDRLALALFVPLGVLAFALVVIYGLSRIYLALPTTGASIMATIVALGILGLSAYFASNPRIPRWQWMAVAVVGFGSLAIGGTVAAVYDEEHKEEAHVEPTPPPDGGGTPVAPGVPVIEMQDNSFDQTSLTITAGQEVVIPVNNNGTAIHNVNVAVSGSFASEEPCNEGEPGCSDPDSIRGGQSGTVTLNLAAGTYDFRCDFHIDEMSGTITAQ
jgi:plastocyanin/heme-degrading monooxygenase HmoA